MPPLPADRRFRSCLITGASSGLGSALAQALAAPGVTLSLLGRDPARLAAVADACAARGATVATAAIDVTDHAALAAWILAQDDAAPLDLVIANAGISGGSADGLEGSAQAARIRAVNVDGVAATVEPLIPRLTARGRGTIALMSSLAGFRGLPGAPAYCASKAWVRVWGEALRADLAARGVVVSVICPGFVDTPMTRTRNKFRMPLLMDAPRAAGIILDGLARGRARIAFPRRMAALVWLLAALPPGWVEALLARLPRKSAMAGD